MDIDTINETAFHGARIPSKLIPDEIFADLNLLWSSLLLVICPLGLWANWLVIRTFLRMGLNDSITISFFFLGLSDFAHVFSPLLSIVFYVLDFMEARFKLFLKFKSVLMNYYVFMFSSTFNNVTMFITTFLALQRCLCIVKPLHFKDMFTKKLTWCIMGCFSAFSCAVTSTYFVSYEVVEVTNPYTNDSQYVIMLQPWWESMNMYVGMPVFTVFPIVCQCLVTGSVIVMGYGLKASIKFRKDAASSVIHTAQRIETLDKGRVVDREKDEEGGGRETSKERTAITQVVILSTVFLVTNLPKIMLTLVPELIPGLRLEGEYENLFRILISIRLSSDYLNSGVNFFIYYKYNTKFRKLCFAPRNKVVKGVR